MPASMVSEHGDESLTQLPGRAYHAEFAVLEDLSGARIGCRPTAVPEAKASR